MTCTSRRYPAWIDRLLVTGLDPWRWRRLRRHLATCAACRAYYGRAIIAWRRATNDRDELPPAVTERLAEDLLNRLAPTPARRLRWAWAGAALGSLAAGAVVLHLRGDRPPGGGAGGDPGVLRERGAAPARARGVRAFCLTEPAGGGEPSVRGAASTAREGEPESALRCGLSGGLQFAYTLGPGAEEHLVLVGRDAAGRRLWYAPAPGEPASAALRPGLVDEPLPSSVRLGLNHREGEVVVEAFFLERPLPVGTVRALLEDGPAGAPLPGTIDRQRLTLRLER